MGPQEDLMTRLVWAMLLGSCAAFPVAADELTTSDRVRLSIGRVPEACVREIGGVPAQKRGSHGRVAGRVGRGAGPDRALPRARRLTRFRSRAPLCENVPCRPGPSHPAQVERNDMAS